LPEKLLIPGVSLKAMEPRSQARVRPGKIQKGRGKKKKPVLQKALPAKSQLCARCSTIDLDCIFSGKQDPDTLRYRLELGPFKNWMIDSCGFCEFLAAQIPPIHKRMGRSPNDFCLADSPDAWARRYLPLDPLCDNVLLQLGWLGRSGELCTYAGTQHFISQPEVSGKIRLLKANSIDFSIIRNWLKLCHDCHGKTCGSTNQPNCSLIYN